MRGQGPRVRREQSAEQCTGHIPIAPEQGCNPDLPELGLGRGKTGEAGKGAHMRLISSAFSQGRTRAQRRP